MEKKLSQIQYVKDVLGVQNFLRPKSFNYRFYGLFQADCLLFFYEPYEGENKELIHRMMKALKIFSYGCVHVSEPLNENALESLILRSQAPRVCFFGEIWKPFIKNYLNCNLSLNQIGNSDVRVALTYSLEEFIGKSPTVREKKLQSFQLLKEF